MACTLLQSGDAPSFENVKPQYTTRSLLNSHLAIFLKPRSFLDCSAGEHLSSWHIPLLHAFAQLCLHLSLNAPFRSCVKCSLMVPCMGYFSRWPSSVSKPLLRYKPMCVEKVVMFRELSFNSSWWYPFDKSKWKNTVEPPRSFTKSSMVGCWISLRGMVWFANSHVHVQSHLALNLKLFGVDNRWW